MIRIGPFLPFEHSDDPRFGTVPLNSAHRHEGTQRKEEILIEGVPWEFLDPVDASGVQRPTREIIAVTIITGDLPGHDGRTSLQWQDYQIANFNCVSDRPNVAFKRVAKASRVP